MSVTIPQYTIENGVILYQINTRLPLRSINTSKRYSDFLALRDALCAESGISRGDFPYPLPPKSGVFSSKEKVAFERKLKLAEFLQHLIRDREFQNSPLVHRFLNVPSNFQFTLDLFDSTTEQSRDEKFTISESALSIDKAQWLIYCRHLRSTVNALSASNKIADRVANRDKCTKYIQPNLEKLAAALANLLDRNELTPDEIRSRKTRLIGIQEKLDSIMGETTVPVSEAENSIGEKLSLSSRNLAQPNTCKETDETMGVSNNELLLKQQQIHQDQDKEIEALRKVIARQRQMGEAINAEVEEQNEMLSTFSDEIERSATKVSQARGRTRKIG